MPDDGFESSRDFVTPPDAVAVMLLLGKLLISHSILHQFLRNRTRSICLYLPEIWMKLRQY